MLNKRLVGIALALLAVASAVLITAGYLRAPASPPRPVAASTSMSSSAPTPSARSATPGPSTPAASQPSTLGPSDPLRVDIPAIDVHAPTTPLGVDSSGEVELPPLDQPQLTSWYRLGVSPGERGNAVIMGHVDSARSGPSVFYSLGNLKPGQTIEVTRRDNTVAVFTIDRVTLYDKDAIPKADIFGPSDHAGLRLITCGGAFDSHERSYVSNVVVFASLQGSREASAADLARPLHK
jgi:hypothetical protein